MPRPSKSRTLAVWMNGEHVGVWIVRSGRSDEFCYAREWLSALDARPISLSMPLRPAPFKGEPVLAYFDNLLPDARHVRERLQRRFGAPSSSAFDLLTEIGRDCVGAIQLLPPEHVTPDVRRIDAVAITPKQIEKLLSDVLSNASGGDPDDAFRISLAGAQEKTALLRLKRRWMRPSGATPTTHILKLPIGMAAGGTDLSTSVENEWLCAQLLRAYGVAVAECSMARFGSRSVLVVERFDRRHAPDGSWIIRLPQEDLCQAFGVRSENKYEATGGIGIVRIMELLLGSSRSEQDRRDFFKVQMLFWMLCAIDGHAKNFSLFIEAGGSYRLTPIYDVISAFPILGRSSAQLPTRKVKLAMAVGERRHYGWHQMEPRHWQQTAKKCGIASAFPAIREELVESTPRVIESIASGLPPGFPDAIFDSIVTGLKRTHQKLATARL